MTPTQHYVDQYLYTYENEDHWYYHYVKEGHKHTVIRSYRRNQGHYGVGEKQFALLADNRYWKSIGAPLVKHPDKLRRRNSWDEYEDEAQSEVANWKQNSKCHHQYEVDVQRKYQKLKRQETNK
ncbi:hypothetical protein N6G95_09510 [Pediococcus inopinatus]|uniref:hypothetical protein n=1 Tax=Pediococcus inopinatus TaxID=114090 RepID=UPI002B25BFE3|nr:hypothetical protein [Pediococcus inopinatus]WPC19440.1 hypothetical protein N6G95_09510 [Pediococcus inopinatus]